MAADNQLWGDLGKGGTIDPNRADESRPVKLVVTKEHIAVFALLTGLVLVSVGAGVQWGIGAGLFTAGVVVVIVGVLLGISSD